MTSSLQLMNSVFILYTTATWRPYAHSIQISAFLYISTCKSYAGSCWLWVFTMVLLGVCSGIFILNIIQKLMNNTVLGFLL